ncbi:unnamed protein product [marine sediment metagenome]|uniref:Uncharacterized protein n=1 Tax=marine sediment metagenome TaxID=412755 RepID=X1RU27_9ZZZZ
MNQLIVPQQVQSLEQAQPLTVQAQWISSVTSVIMIVWMGAFVVQQVIKVIKREEIERPPIIPK